MKFICDAPGDRVWFRIETDAEAARESEMMSHAVEKYFRAEKEKAAQTYRPASRILIEQEIGMNAHIQREMPLFLTLRDGEGNALVTAMLPRPAPDRGGGRAIIVGVANGDPYVDHADAIRALGDHFAVELDRDRCYPYRRG
jgi:hypothetical protein